MTVENMCKNISLVILGLTSVMLLSGCFNNALPTELYVDTTYTSSVSGWGIDRFDSIQLAVDHCADQGTVYVSNGTYRETIFINKPLSLIGADANNTIIMGGGIDVNLIELGSLGNITLSGFTIKDCRSSETIPPPKAGLFMTSNGSSICGNRFINNTYGLYLDPSSHNTISNNFFSENEYGIYLNTFSEVSNVTNNAFVDNHVGMRMKGSGFNIVSNNIFVDNYGGVYLCCVANKNRFFLNYFSRNSQFHAEDWCNNIWNASGYGNFWDDFSLPTQGAIDQDSNGIVDVPYSISRGYNPEEYPNKDYFPLAQGPRINNSFFTLE